MERRLDLNEHLIRNPVSTFFLRVEGDSMAGAGILSGDLIVVDKAAPARPGAVVVAELEGEFTVKRLERGADGAWCLRADGPAGPRDRCLSPANSESGAPWWRWSAAADPMLRALADCNNFYASCERVLDPSLRDVPIVVLSNNDGCVIARSAEAKALGIAMGAPYFEVRRTCGPTACASSPPTSPFTGSSRSASWLP